MEKKKDTQGVNMMNYTYQLGFMFRAPVKEIVTDTIISSVTAAKYIHIDMLFIPPVKLSSDLSGRPVSDDSSYRADTIKQLFSTFVGEKFSSYRPSGWTERTNTSHGMLVLDVSEEEYDRARSVSFSKQSTVHSHAILTTTTTSPLTGNTSMTCVQQKFHTTI